jgi:hypothetical protein
MAKTKSVIFKVNRPVKPRKTKPVEKKTVSLLLGAGYQDKKAETKLEEEGFAKVDKFTNANHTVYLDKERNPYIIHRGTSTLNDFVTDAFLFTGLEKYHPRFREAKRLTNKVRQEFDKPVTVVGHSLGGSLAEESGGDHIITVNKGVGLGGIGKIIPENQVDLRRRGDLVSALSNLQYIQDKDTSVMSTANPFILHKYQSILSDDPNASV